VGIQRRPYNGVSKNPERGVGVMVMRNHVDLISESNFFLSFALHAQLLDCLITSEM